MHNYIAYGISIRSEIRLREFIPRSGVPDVTIRYSSNAESAGDFSAKDYHVEVKPGYAHFWFKEVGGFVVKDGKTIEVLPVDNADASLIRLYIEGIVMAMLLHQRGFCVLHASVVKMGGRAVAFLGPVGAGKSSLAAAMHARGHAVISDDNAAIRLTPQAVEVAPAYPYVKLFPAIAVSLGYRAEQLHELHGSQEKIAGAVDRGFSSHPLALDRLYILRREGTFQTRSLPATPTLLELIRNSVPTRWGCPGDAEHLQRCGDLARRIPVFTAKTFESLAELPDLAERIERHCLTGRDFIPATRVTAESELSMVGGD